MTRITLRLSYLLEKVDSSAGLKSILPSPRIAEYYFSDIIDRTSAATTTRATGIFANLRLQKNEFQCKIQLTFEVRTNTKVL